MIRLLTIPAAGTIAALIAIVLAHKPRPEKERTEDETPIDLSSILKHPETHEEETKPELLEYQIELQADGTLLDGESGETYPSVEALAAALGKEKHTIVLAQGDDVTDEKVEEVAAKLREHYQVRPAPLPEPREYQLEIQADGSFLDRESGHEYASVKELSHALRNVRHTLVLTNATGVTEAAIDDALAKLRDRYQVRKVYRAPETPPGEGR